MQRMGRSRYRLESRHSHVALMNINATRLCRSRSLFFEEMPERNHDDQNIRDERRIRDGAVRLTPLGLLPKLVGPRNDIPL